MLISNVIPSILPRLAFNFEILTDEEWAFVVTWTCELMRDKQRFDDGLAIAHRVCRFLGHTG